MTFLRADAQAYPFPSERFDLVVSRFGTMFFSDPVAAFANVGRALRRAGRLAMMVWQGHEQNQWSVVIEDALGGSGDSPASEAPDPFSLAEPAKVDGILDAAGFTAVTFSDVQRPIFFGQDVGAALEWVRGFTSTQETPFSSSSHPIWPLSTILSGRLIQPGPRWPFSQLCLIQPGPPQPFSRWLSVR